VATKSGKQNLWGWLFTHGKSPWPQALLESGLCAAQRSCGAQPPPPRGPYCRIACELLYLPANEICRLAAMSPLWISMYTAKWRNCLLHLYDHKMTSIEHFCFALHKFVSLQVLSKCQWQWIPAWMVFKNVLSCLFLRTLLPITPGSHLSLQGDN
jgi:hypothetical protein